MNLICRILFTALSLVVVGFISAPIVISAALTDPTIGKAIKLPTLNGEKAVEYLKQSGEYNRLTQAFTAEQYENAQASGIAGFEQSAKLTASDGLPFDGFGSSVAISGNTAVIGASAADIGVNPNQGSAYAFVRNGGSWTLQAKLDRLKQP